MHDNFMHLLAYDSAPVDPRFADLRAFTGQAHCATAVNQAKLVVEF